MSSKSCWDDVQIRSRKVFLFSIGILILVFLFAPIAAAQFICLFFILILSGSRFYSEYLIRNISVSRSDSELRVFKHEWVRVELKVENRGLLPAFMMVAADSPGSLQVFNMNKTYCTLFKRSWVLHVWEGYCAERGLFTIGPAVVRGADPLGLFPFRLSAAETTRLFVYPVLRSIALKNAGGLPLGNMISKNPLYEDITRYRSLRPYHPGDEPRRINWKTSAHVSGGQRGACSANSRCGLLVNEYEATASYPLMIFLNLDQNEYPVRKKRVFMERAIEAAAALCLKASMERQDTGIIFYASPDEGGISVIAPSSFTLVPILERLAAVECLNPVAKSMRTEGRGSMIAMLNQGKRLPYGTRYIYAGPDLGDESYINLNSLKRHHLTLEYLVINEQSVPSRVPGNSPRYQMREAGYEII